MEYYVAVRNRCFIDSKWLNEVLSCQKGNSIYGPYDTIEAVNEQYKKVVEWVDDDDYAVFAHDDKKRWWRIVTYKDGTSEIRLVDRSLGWKEVKTASIETAINAET